MKLIDLLVKELPKRGGWPEGYDVVSTNGYGAVWAYKTVGCIIGRELYFRSTTEGHVTRAQYEAALAKNDGWIEWGGGECPVDESVDVDIRLEDGSERSDFPASAFIWPHDEDITNIIAYRQHLDINSRANDDRLEQDLNECIGQDVDVINHPSHYTRGSIECIDAIASATVGKSGIEAVCVANAIKYLWRYEEKNGIEDVKKAAWYLNKLISEMESK